jgi:hypothetical protein
MVMSEDRARQIVEIGLAGLAVVALPIQLSLVDATFANVLGSAPRASDPVRPAELADGFVALRVVDKHIDSEHGRHLCSKEIHCQREGEWALSTLLPESAIERILKPLP